MRRAAVFTIFVLGAMSFGAVAEAKPVVLVTNDGYTRIEGDLIEMDAEFYVVKTSVGTIRIPIADVKCDGAGCPGPTPEPAAQPQNELSQDQQLELFRAFLEWRKNNEDFEQFLEWRKNNPN